MRRKINKIKLYISDNNNSKIALEKLQDNLVANEYEITDNNYELAISVGGDGSFLKMVNDNKFNSSIYYIGVNAGTLGFLQEIDIDKTDDFIYRLSNNDYKIEEISFLEIKVYHDNTISSFNSLNEFVMRKKDFSVLKTPIYIDNELLENFTGDGILISTATGSTAYNMSFHGPIIYSSLNAFILTAIAPINNRAYNTLANSIVIPNDKKVLVTPNKTDIFLMIDGKNKEIDNVSKVEIEISKRKIKCIRMNEFHFIRTINQKIIEKK